MFRAYFFRELCREKRRKGLDSFGSRTQCCGTRRIDAENAHAAVFEEPQQRSVVAADLDHKGAGCELCARNNRIRHAPEMLGQAERDRRRIREVGVLNFWVDDVEQLQMTA